MRSVTIAYALGVVSGIAPLYGCPWWGVVVLGAVAFVLALRSDRGHRFRGVLERPTDCELCTRSADDHPKGTD